MGRTKHFLCRQARRLGLTQQDRPSRWAAVWKYKTEADARVIFEEFKSVSLGLGQFCASRGIDDLGFSRCMKEHFPDEWEHVIEAKQITSSLYRYGRQFEYRVRDQLRTLGYFAQRSPASKTPIDVTAIRPGAVLLIQCKRHGALPPREWNEIFDIASSCGALPVLASCPKGRGTSYHLLLARKDGTARRQPMRAFDPADPTSAKPELRIVVRPAERAPSPESLP